MLQRTQRVTRYPGCSACSLIWKKSLSFSKLEAWWLCIAAVLHSSPAQTQAYHGFPPSQCISSTSTFLCINTPNPEILSLFFFFFNHLWEPSHQSADLWMSAGLGLTGGFNLFVLRRAILLQNNVSTPGSSFQHLSVMETLGSGKHSAPLSCFLKEKKSMAPEVSELEIPLSSLITTSGAPLILGLGNFILFWIRFILVSSGSCANE